MPRKFNRFSSRLTPNATGGSALRPTLQPFIRRSWPAGTETETKAAADSFKIFYERENDAASPDGYSMAHSPGLFLIGPDGEWLRQFTYGTPAADILSDLQTRF